MSPEMVIRHFLPQTSEYLGISPLLRLRRTFRLWLDGRPDSACRQGGAGLTEGPGAREEAVRCRPARAKRQVLVAGGISFHTHRATELASAELYTP